jgi:hypothetical protein
VGPEGWLRQAFYRTLAETRLPNNDVHAFDQSYVAAVLFHERSRAGAILEGGSFRGRYKTKIGNEKAMTASNNRPVGGS